MCQKKTKVWTIKDNFRLGDDLQSKILAFAFSLSAEIERNLISQRTKEALQRIKHEGKKLGRPIGKKNKIYKIDQKKEKILKLIEKNKNITHISKKVGLSPKTIYSFLKNKR